MGIPSAIRYLRECYREDNVRGGLWDLFGGKVVERVVIDGAEQLADGLLDHIAFPRGHHFEELSREAAVRAGEYELLYGLLFVSGCASLPGLERPRKICAPLFVYPARLDSERRGFPSVEIDLTDRRINLPLLDVLGGPDSNLAAEVAAEMSDAPLGEGEVTLLEALLRERCGDLDVSEMMTYPQLLKAKRFRILVTSSGEEGATRKLLPAAALALWPKSEAVRGIVTELGSMADGEVFSKPVQALLGNVPIAPGHRKERDPPLVPAVLSSAQEAILDSARHCALTFVNGPPGTGKSFTIAAVALDHLARGQSVLIASQSDNAVDVVGDKIEAAHGVGGCLVRAGKRQYLRALKKEIETILGGGRAGGVQGDSGSASKRGVRQLFRHLRRLSAAFEKCRLREERWGEVLRSQGGGPLAWVRRRVVRWKVGRAEPMPELISKHDDHLERILHGTKEGLVSQRNSDLIECLRRNRPELMRFSKALRARKGSRKESLFKQTNFDAVLAAFPIWLVKLADVSSVLPLDSELFDVAIIDEATQCDMASALPVLQRARRVVIAGDPKQLRHLSFLSRTRQRQLGAKFGVSEDDPFADYRSSSLLDLVSGRIVGQDQVGFLNEHFRSLPDLIAFSNDRFYGGRLNVMTEVPSSRPPKSGLSVLRVEGERSQGGENAAEVAAVIRRLRAIVAGGGEQSIGVLSPFRAQVDAVREAAVSEFSASEFATLADRHRMRIGTAHSFQGDERDVMVVSLAIDAESAGAGLRFLERPDVFNVSITRARFEQYILCSFDPRDLPSSSMLREYLTHVFAGHAGPNFESVDEKTGDIADALRAEGYKVHGRSSVAGVVFDMIACKGTRCLAIDLIGFPGRGGSALPLENYRMFRRAGTRVFPLTYGAWQLRRGECLSALRDALDR